MLVTGGAGFIGSNFVRVMLDNHPTLLVCVLDKLTYAGCKENLQEVWENPRLSFVEGDICDAKLVADLFARHKFDTVIHFAAESHVDNSISGPAAFIQTNFVGSFVLLEAARTAWLSADGKSVAADQRRFVHVSTDEVYGQLTREDSPFEESTPYDPRSPYSATKAGADHLASAYFHTYGLPVVITNCSNNYGPRQHDEKFLPTVIRSCRHQQPIPIYGDGSNIRDWLWVEDHCHGIDRAARLGQTGRSYNFGGNCERPNIEVARKICHLMDVRYPDNAPHEKLLTFVEDRLGHDWRYAVSFQRAQAELGWRPTTNFEQGLADTVDWYAPRY
ncbi:putative dTDP-glucose 4,6-dehydratase [Magnetofaba australis IT-1]|uniref:dTDP-glucose 4,6-dehydratase n=2 Tax=Magnetofaba TaxID=1472292 RepID=A0A1Y2K7Z3_9PROT|nr:putative dTDP-glucose 4,6-dehydratase [Magnetofaba australis IT-1]